MRVPPPTPHLSPMLYLKIWIALMLLLFATWGVAEFNLGPFNTVIAVIIAFTKMMLVILFFMHVRYGSKLTWLFAGAGFFWLCIMITLTLGDYLSRGANFAR